MPNAFDDFVFDGAPFNGGDPVDLATASMEELCTECEAVWEITAPESEVEEC